jgi:nitrite reductase/ring-hydroxylating ferredoxin subunit
MTEYKVGNISELSREGSRKIIKVGETEIGIFRRRGRLYAYENFCKHQGGPVCEGVVVGKVEAVLAEDKRILCETFSEETAHVACPWHGWEYELETGQCVSDKRFRLKSYEVIARGDELYVLV